MNPRRPAVVVPRSVSVPSLPIAYADTVPGSVPLPRFTTYAYFPNGSKAIQPGPIPAVIVVGVNCVSCPAVPTADNARLGGRFTLA